MKLDEYTGYDGLGLARWCGATGEPERARRCRPVGNRRRQPTLNAVIGAIDRARRPLIAARRFSAFPF